MWSTFDQKRRGNRRLFICDKHGQNILLIEDKMLEKTQYKATLIFVLSLGKMP